MILYTVTDSETASAIAYVLRQRRGRARVWCAGGNLLLRKPPCYPNRPAFNGGNSACLSPAGLFGSRRDTISSLPATLSILYTCECC